MLLRFELFCTKMQTSWWSMSLRISAAASWSGMLCKERRTLPPWSQPVSPVDTKLGLMSKSDSLQRFAMISLLRSVSEIVLRGRFMSDFYRLVNSVLAVKLRVSLSKQSLIYRSSVLAFGLLDPAFQRLHFPQSVL